MNEYLNRVNRPAQTVNRGPADGSAQPPVVNGGAKKPKKKINFSRVFFVVFSVLVAIVLLGAIYLLATGQGKSTSSQINGDQYQAIFLNSADGQVYFGKLSILNRDYYKLTDIYYVRVQTVQPDKNQTAQQNISLAKLGNEIHGPEDVMYVNKDSVMFWENLKEDGQVVKAIREYQKNPDAANNANNTTNTNTSNQ
jgi:hypothetical protein